MDTDFPGAAAAPVRPAFPGWWQAFALMLVAMSVQFMVGFAVGFALWFAAAASGAELPPRVYAHPGIAIFTNVVSLGLVLWLAPKLLARAPWAEIYPLRRVSLSGVLLTPPILIGMGILGSEADNVVRSFLPMPKAVGEAFEELTRGDPVFSLIVLVVVAPVTEELLFRGLILRGFLLRYGPGLAIVAQALLFALFHANPWQFVSPLALGALFGWLAVRTGSLVLPLLGHAITNGLVYALPYMGLEVQGLTGDPSGATEFQPLWLDGMGLGLVVLGVALLHRVLGRAAVPQSA